MQPSQFVLQANCRYPASEVRDVNFYRIKPARRTFHFPSCKLKRLGVAAQPVYCAIPNLANALIMRGVGVGVANLTGAGRMHN